MTSYRILYWKDIPAQIKVYPAGGRPLSRELPERFQRAIDARAMQEGLAGTDQYLEQWRWSEKQESELAPEELIEALIRELC
jgi:hypothetical protein